MQKGDIEEGSVYAVSSKTKRGRSSYSRYGSNGNYGKPSKVIEIDPSVEILEELGLYYRVFSTGSWYSKPYPRDAEEKDLDHVNKTSGKGTKILVEWYPEETEGQDEHANGETKYQIVHSSNVKMEWEQAREKIQQYRKREKEKEERQERKKQEFLNAIDEIKANTEVDLEEVARIKDGKQKLQAELGREQREKFLEFLPYDMEIVEDAVGINQTDVTFNLEGTKKIAKKLRNS